LRFSLYISLLLISSSVIAQETDSLNANQIFQQQIEGISEKALANRDFSEIAENLDFLKNHKINLNSASGEELKQLPILDIFQINNLLRYRERNGEFYSIFELTSIQGFDKEIVRSISPFIEIKPIDTNSKSFKEAFRYSNHQLITRFQTVLQTPKGYIAQNDSIDKKYRGEKYKIYTRYLFTASDKVRFGFTLEKDSGEKFGDVNTTLGWDYSSFHLEIKDLGFANKIIFGDYNLEFGQGLAVWSSFSTNKSSYATNIVKLGRGTTPYAGANENVFFRGVTAQMQFGNLQISPFYSYNKIDASISHLLENEEEFNTYETGLHRTDTEIAKKNTLTKVDFGADLSYRQNNLKFGITAINTTFDNNLAKGNKEYQLFNFDKKTISTISGHYIWNLNTVVLSGEHAINQNGAWATIHNISVNPTPEFSFVLSYRNYQKNYFSAINAPFSEYTTTGEKAYYLGINSQLHKYLTISAYIDIFEKTWLQYQKDAPTKGLETLIQFDTPINRSSSAYFRIKYEKKHRNFSTDSNFLNELKDENKINFRIHFNKIVNRNLRLASRAEVVKYTHNTSETGWLIFQDIKWKFSSTPFSIYGRVAFFDIASWNSRIYAYENDISYIFTVPAYYNRGTRYYLGASYKLNRNFSFWCRASLTDFENAESIGSGNEEIKGNQKAEIKLQLRIKL
jgi:DNA uptake protein ComE-like DNA-binding protein